MGTEPVDVASALVRRPHTVLPDVMLAVDSTDLAAMDDFQLRQFAEQHLSITFPVGTVRGVMMTKIANEALVLVDELPPPWDPPY